MKKLLYLNVTDVDSEITNCFNSLIDQLFKKNTVDVKTYAYLDSLKQHLESITSLSGYEHQRYSEEIHDLKRKVGNLEDEVNNLEWELHDKR